MKIRTRPLLFFLLLQLAMILGVIWIIAGSDTLFRSTVPIEQRLVSSNESIRRKAQQELLGMGAAAKQEAALRLVPSLDRGDPFVRKWAAIALALIGPSAQPAIPALLQHVSANEKDVAQAARVALTEIGAPDAEQLPSLLRALQDAREAVRCEAASSIAKMGPAAQEAAPVLTGYFKGPSPSPACFEEALAALTMSLPATLPPVVELLGSGHAEIRRKAAHVLSQASVKTPEIIGPLLRTLSSEKDADIREYLAKALQLSETPDADPLAVLKAALRAKGAAVRLEAARWIRQTGLRGKSAEPFFLRMARDSEPAVRRLAFEILRQSGLRAYDLFPIAAKAQRDKDPGVRCRAAEALVEMGVPDRVSIALLIKDMEADEDTARCAVDALSLAGYFEPNVVRSMTRLLQEKDPEARSRAALVLMRLGTRAREAIPALAQAQRDKVPGAENALKAIRAALPRRK